MVAPLLMLCLVSELQFSKYFLQHVLNPFYQTQDKGIKCGENKALCIFMLPQETVQKGFWLFKS